MTSDLHVDHYVRKPWNLEQYIKDSLKPADVLCVAGDTCDNPNLFVEFYKSISSLYKKIFVIFGNHDLTVGNQSYFRDNQFMETQPKIDFLKQEISKIENISILDGSVEEYEGVKFGGAMAFNDWTWAFKLEPEPDGNISKFLSYWHYWFDYVNWDYMKNNHSEIFKKEITKLDTVVAQKPDIILTHYIPLFFGVEQKYYNQTTTTFFYFNGEKYLDKLKDNCIWLAGHTHIPCKKDLVCSDGRIIHLKINPVGYPEERKSNFKEMEKFFVEI